jgi:hypothetical protein
MLLNKKADVNKKAEAKKVVRIQEPLEVKQPVEVKRIEQADVKEEGEVKQQSKSFLDQYYAKVDESIQSRTLTRTGSDGSKIRVDHSMIAVVKIKK